MRGILSTLVCHLDLVLYGTWPIWTGMVLEMLPSSTCQALGNSHESQHLYFYGEGMKWIILFNI